MANTVLSALKELHESDESITQHISEGVFYQVCPDRLDLSEGGALVLDFKEMTWKNENFSTEYVRPRVRVDLLYFHYSLETLDQLILPWVRQRFDDIEGLVLLEGTEVWSVDVCPEGESIRMGLEHEKTKDGKNMFSLLVPLQFELQSNRVGTED